VIGDRNEMASEECCKIIWPIVMPFSSWLIVCGTINIDIDLFHFLRGFIVRFFDSSWRNKDVISTSSKENWDLRKDEVEGEKRSFYLHM
jgi:hypothetical protein